MNVLQATLSIGAMLAAPAAFAQDAAQTAPQTTESAAPAQAAAAVTDAEVDQYVTAALAVNKVQTDASIADADKGAKMAEAVTASGISTDRFNAITQAMQADPALNKRIQEAAAAKTAATPAG